MAFYLNSNDECADIPIDDINKFTLLEKIAEEEFGNSWEAENKFSQNEYLIKQIYKEKINEALKEILTGISFLHRINNSNILRLISCSEDETSIYLILEKPPRLKPMTVDLCDFELKQIFLGLIILSQVIQSSKLIKKFRLLSTNMLWFDNSGIMKIDIWQNFIKDSKISNDFSPIKNLGIIFYELLAHKMPQGELEKNKLKFPLSISYAAKMLVKTALFNDEISLEDLLDFEWLNDISIDNISRLSNISGKRKSKNTPRNSFLFTKPSFAQEKSPRNEDNNDDLSYSDSENERDSMLLNSDFIEEIAARESIKQFKDRIDMNFSNSNLMKAKILEANIQLISLNTTLLSLEAEVDKRTEIADRKNQEENSKLLLSLKKNRKITESILELQEEYNFRLDDLEHLKAKKSQVQALLKSQETRLTSSQFKLSTLKLELSKISSKAKKFSIYKKIFSPVWEESKSFLNYRIEKVSQTLLKPKDLEDAKSYISSLFDQEDSSISEHGEITIDLEQLKSKIKKKNKLYSNKEEDILLAQKDYKLAKLKILNDLKEERQNIMKKAKEIWELEEKNRTESANIKAQIEGIPDCGLHSNNCNDIDSLFERIKILQRKRNETYNKIDILEHEHKKNIEIIGKNKTVLQRIEYELADAKIPYLITQLEMPLLRSKTEKYVIEPPNIEQKIRYARFL
ncbi:unnamed protein product [Blepharisma stoltei]|uniref:Protein kinase domain-containing protein n=1 Tax=Blepharisma stoltei TaxID=1481888 RepID=A0AAU9K1L0_9CILI|nr:unnamed protein product [Blepharisma stoltei]